MDDLLAPSDLIRLIDVVSAFAKRQGCSVHDAIQQLDLLTSNLSGARTPRPIPAFAERQRSIRLKRNEALKVNAFRDPGWDMLIDLYVSRDQNRPSSTSSLCIGSGAPATTALRYIDRLERGGLIVRRSDHRDNRRTLIELAPGVRDRLEALLAKLQDCY